MIAVWIKISAAVSLETAALSMLSSTPTQLHLVSYFLLHAVASAVVTWLAWVLLPNNFKKPFLPACALLWAFAFFIPVLGVTAILIVVQVAKRFPRILRTERYVTVRMPEFSGVQREATERGDLRAGDARRILKDATQPLETRLRVLVALQSMEPKAAVPLLISLLSDPSEDIRLLAYSMVDSWEKDLVQKIQRANAELDVARESGSNTLIVNALRRLAELHWTQADTGLARGDLRRFALEHAQQYCEQVQALDTRAPGIWALYARILTELGHLVAAVKAVKMARRLRMPMAEAYSLMAQIAYAQRNYPAVRRYANMLPDDGLLPSSVLRSAAFWRNRRRIKKVDIRV
ncbi:MAG: hypothetical protein H7228_02035 [Polaromonas sp.]|nr:hypothetical protein [Polaromonas sp.]